MQTCLKLLVLAFAMIAAAREARALPTAEVAVVRSERSALLRSLVPGLGQLDRGDRLKGWVVVATEGALLVTALGFQLAADAARRESSADFYAAPARSGAFAAGQRLSDASAQGTRCRDGFLVAAAGVWALSFVDAYLSRSHGGAASPAADELAIGERTLLPTASLSRGGLVAGLSLKF